MGRKDKRGGCLENDLKRLLDTHAYIHTSILTSETIWKRSTGFKIIIFIIWFLMYGV